MRTSKKTNAYKIHGLHNACIMWYIAEQSARTRLFSRSALTENKNKIMSIIFLFKLTQCTDQKQHQQHALLTVLCLKTALFLSTDTVSYAALTEDRLTVATMNIKQ